MAEVPAMHGAIAGQRVDVDRMGSAIEPFGRQIIFGATLLVLMFVTVASDSCRPEPAARQRLAVGSEGVQYLALFLTNRQRLTATPRSL
jgi:hypothetical protein